MELVISCYFFIRPLKENKHKQMKRPCKKSNTQEYDYLRAFHLTNKNK